VPAEARAFVEPLIPAIVAGIHEASSIAVASTFWVGIAGALIAAFFALFLREQRMRTTFEMDEPDEAPEGPAPEPEEGGDETGGDALSRA
jgi:hypothetical protein